MENVAGSTLNFSHYSVVKLRKIVLGKKRKGEAKRGE